MTRMSQAQVYASPGAHLNTPAFRRFFAGPWLAIQLGVIVCALATPSCLMPQGVDPIVESPHPPPHFVLDQIPGYLLAPRLDLYRQGSLDLAASPACHCKLELFIPFVQEDDPTITLEARWFVDYDPDVPRLAAVVSSETLTGDFNDATATVRPLQKRFNFDADALGINTNGTHTVDVVIAETAAYDPNSTARPNRALKPGYTGDEYRFFIDVKVDQDANRPQCPQQLPSIRVCQ